MDSKFMIHFAGSMYSNELYNTRGEHIFDLIEAIAESEDQFPNAEYELYNGDEGYSNYKEF